MRMQTPRKRRCTKPAKDQWKQLMHVSNRGRTRKNKRANHWSNTNITSGVDVLRRAFTPALMVLINNAKTHGVAIMLDIQTPGNILPVVPQGKT